jgi:HEPN domain-containing protein
MHSGRTVWGHAITPMLHSLTEIQVPEQIIRDGQLLDTCYILTRSPDGTAEGKPADYFNESNARQAIHAAGAIIRFCKDLFDQAG